MLHTLGAKQRQAALDKKRNLGGLLAVSSPSATRAVIDSTTPPLTILAAKSCLRMLGFVTHAITGSGVVLARGHIYASLKESTCDNRHPLLACIAPLCSVAEYTAGFIEPNPSYAVVFYVSLL